MGASASRPDDFAAADSDLHLLDYSTTSPPHSPFDAHHLPHPSTIEARIAPDHADDDDFSIAELKWNYGGHSVYVTGAWDSWNTKYALYRTHHNEFTAVLLLPVGTFQYKFIVDGNWRHSPSLPTERDAHGNLNNLITIVARRKDFDSNDLPHDDDKPPHIDSENYDFSLLPPEDQASEPPTIPRMLSSAPLDRSAQPKAPTPDFVRLNHVFETDSSAVFGVNQVRTVATEFRLSSKVISTILITSKFKPSFNHNHHPNHSQHHLNHQQQQQQDHSQQQQPQPHHHHYHTHPHSHQSPPPSQPHPQPPPPPPLPQSQPHPHPPPPPPQSFQPLSSAPPPAVSQSESEALIMDALHNV